MLIRELIKEGCDELRKITDTPWLDSTLLLAKALKISREKLLASYPDEAGEEEEKLFKEYLSERLKGHPVAYILGEKEFFGLTFLVKEGVLTPRPDTEILVESSLELIEKNGFNAVLDMCTGTGCIAISLKHTMPGLKVTASDISPVAEEVCKENARRLIESDFTFIHSSLFDNIEEKFDLIATNPPYLTCDETQERMDEGWKEPALALDGGEDGLDLIRTIIEEARDHLNPGGWLLIEAGSPQMAEMKRVMETFGYEDIKILRDLEERDRVIAGKYGLN